MPQEPEWIELDELLAIFKHNLTPQPGWTDSEEYIRDPNNSTFRIMGRWFIKRGTNHAECLE